MSPARRLHWRLACVAIACLSPAACTGAPRGGAGAPPPGGRRVILLGLDAADWQVLDPLVAAGKLPAFARLESVGRTGILEPTPPLLSPILWTTIATGRRPEDHGVLDFMVDLPSGGQAPIAVTSRRVPALWNILSSRGRRVAVVGWWATWPAETVDGTIVSDRVAPQLIHPDLKLDAQAIAPASESVRLAKSIVRAADLTYEDLSDYVPLTPAEYERARSAAQRPAKGFYDDPIAHLSAVVAATRTYASMALAIEEAERPDFLAVYLEGIDTVSHLFIRDRRRGPAAIAAAYRDADALLARLAAAAPPDTWIVVCSDHGFEPADAAIAENPADLTGPAAAWHRPYGIVAVAEAGALAAARAPESAPPSPGEGRSLGTVAPLDLAPTLLHLAGVPVSTDMPGRVVMAMLPAEAAQRAVVRVAGEPGYRQATGPAETATSPLDAEVRARLQALGYVGAAPTSLARQNLGEILYREGKLEAAERELRAVVEAQPQNLAAHLWLAKALGAQNRSREALRVYERALALPDGVAAAAVETAELASRAGLLDDGRRILSRLRVAPGSAAALHTARAVLAQATGQPAEAERELRAAVERDPLSFDALSRLFDVLVSAGRAGAFLPLARAAASRAPASPRHLALLGEALLATGDAAAAEQPLSRALALAPGSASVRLELARAQVTQGHADSALATLAPLPPSVEADILLGAAYSQKENWTEAEARYRQALDQGGATPELLNGLAWAKIKLGRTAEAAGLLDRSLALKRDQPQIRRLLAQIHGAAGAAR